MNCQIISRQAIYTRNIKPNFPFTRETHILSLSYSFLFAFSFDRVYFVLTHAFDHAAVHFGQSL